MIKYLLLFFAVAGVVFMGIWGFNNWGGEALTPDVSPQSESPPPTAAPQPPPITPPPGTSTSDMKCYQYGNKISEEEYKKQCDSPYLNQATNDLKLSCEKNRVWYCRSGCSYNLVNIPPGGVGKDLIWPSGICGYVEKVPDTSKEGYSFKAYDPPYFTQAQKALIGSGANTIFFDDVKSSAQYRSCLSGRLGQEAVDTWLKGELVYFPVTALTPEYNKISKDLETCTKEHYNKF